MGLRTRVSSPGLRMQMGASVLAAARAVDTTHVAAKLAAFESAHREYTAAQAVVDAGEAELRTAQQRLAERGAIHDDAIEALAVARASAGQRTNPFDAFGAPAPRTLMRLPIDEEVREARRLVAAVLRAKDTEKGAHGAAKAVDKAARAIEQALVPIAKLQDSVRDARRTRDAVGQGWESALAALKRGARSAADDGAPNLYATLFPAKKVRAPRKKAEPVAPAPEAGSSAA